MAETSRTAKVAKEMREYEIEVLVIRESRWKGMRRLQSGETVVHVMMSARAREPLWNGHRSSKES